MGSTEGETGDLAAAAAHERSEDARVVRSRSAIKEAFEGLAAGQDLASISISGLCKAAGVSRPTFYQHFADIDDVYAAVVRDRLEAGEEHFTRSTEDTDADVLESMLAYVQSHDVRSAPALDVHGALPRARSVVFEWMCERVAHGSFSADLGELSSVQRRRVEFAVGGLMAVLGTSSTRPDGDPVPSEETAAMLRQALGAVLRPGCI